jgi:hypothetical protein
MKIYLVLKAIAALLVALFFAAVAAESDFRHHPNP